MIVIGFLDGFFVYVCILELYGELFLEIFDLIDLRWDLGRCFESIFR